ncbi:MAG: dNTP triphosphohydrolase [Proteobacteria bacterium]|nr:dNTP triphosphohydrolase [Pseudomonadota bacterium]
MRKTNIRALSRYISRSAEDLSTGRYRNDFMRDRDRILYSKPFRRMSRKTQIFLPASDDHVRTRLTHSLEVAQISTISAQALGLDRDLTEAIALGHDIGHTPFGHTGERVLNLIATNCDFLGGLSTELKIEDMGFKHNLQGVRVAADLTDLYENLPGLNLSNYTLWGIQNHTSKFWKKCGYRIKTDYSYECNYPQNANSEKCRHGNNKLVLENRFYDKYDDLLKIRINDQLGHYAWSFEGLLVELADEIAQRHHDIEDGLIANVIQLDDIMDWIKQFIVPYLNKEETRLFKSFKKEEKKYTIPKLSKLVVGCLNRILIDNSSKNLKEFYANFSIASRKDFENLYPNLTLETEFWSHNRKIPIKKIISYPSDVETDESIFKKQLKKGILNSYEVQRMDGKAKFIIRQLAKAYLSNPQQMHDGMINQLFSRCFPDKESIGDIRLDEKRAWLDKMYYSSNKVECRKSLLRLICDFISSMTDDFAILEHARLYSTSESVSLRQY